MSKHDSKRSTKRSAGNRVQTNWDPVADWYAGWTGKTGSKHHRALVIPAILDLLQLQPGMRVLEIGCGHGVLAPYIARHGGDYTGVDISDKLIRRARANHAQTGQFVVGDACKLSRTQALSAGSFDAGIFMLSVQDMEPLSAVLQSAAWAVKVGGIVVLLMMHPCFRVPRQSGWGWDEQRKLQFRRIDRYLTPLRIPMGPCADGSSRGQPGRARSTTLSFHRPLSDYINGLSACGFLLEQMQEIPTYKVRTGGKQARAENAANREIPLFLGLKARRMAL